MSTPHGAWTAVWSLALLAGTALTVDWSSPSLDSAVVTDLLLRIELLTLIVGAASAVVGILAASRRSAAVAAIERGFAVSALLVLASVLVSEQMTRLAPGIGHPDAISLAVRSAFLPPCIATALSLPSVLRALKGNSAPVLRETDSDHSHDEAHE